MHLTAPIARTCIAFAADEEAVTAIEYALLGALMVVACIAAFQAMGGSMLNLYALWSGAVLGAL